jgi:hypothetical protein
VRDEELRSRLQTLARVGQAAAKPAPIAAVRRRGRRKVQAGVVVVLACLLAAGAGTQLLGQSRDSRPALPVAPSIGPPAATAPSTFVGQVGDGTNMQTVIIDARTGMTVRQVPGSERHSDQPAVPATDVVVGPDLRSMYLPVPSTSSTACDSGWTQLDLASGARQPAFGGLKGVSEFSLSADGRWLAFVHTFPAVGGTPALIRSPCDSELAVRDLASKRQRTWTIPQGATVDQLQLSPDAAQFAYRLRQGPDRRMSLHLLPLAGTTQATQGRDLPSPGDCPMSTPRFASDQRLLALAGRGCANGPVERLLATFDLRTGQLVSSEPLALRSEIFSLDVDRSGRYVIIAAVAGGSQARSEAVYVLRNGHLQRVPLPGACWQADW